MKKNLLLGLFALTLVGCSSSPIVDSMTKAHTTVSSFDGSREIYTKPMFVFATTGSHASSILIGADWVEKVPEYISVDVEIRGEYVSLNSLYLNIDGEIKEYKPIQVLTKLNAPNGQTLAPRISARSFMVPVGDIEKVKSAQNVKIKVSTLSSGYFEGVVIRDSRLSPGAKSVINVIDQIAK